MWIMTKKGFVSVVAHRDLPDMLLVRARKRDVLKYLVTEFKIKTVIQRNKKADYLYRMVVDRVTCASIFCALINNIDYDNFKNAVDAQPKSHEYHEFLTDVWCSGYALQYGAYKRNWNGEEKYEL